ncbi:DUF1738 domain-containing protein [Campylobacter sp. faydin G-140]|uniref:ArdC-like ssDNA-binding domain-containing protein n=1 Tax=Campylobacter anatolicus TaxID=2829105 RepID=UPI001B9AAF62|nr:ArdC-like ssDNA-binding domain-containing protein [Campylobacter anatolicus]MBR8466522.1 DUF1738 domain-containing protein [Campylobacter anatolicus]
MAKAKAKIQEQAVEQVQPAQQEPSYKAWEDRSNAERQTSINEYAKIMIAGAMKTKNADWLKDMSAKQIDETMPFDASNGKPYQGISSIILRSAVTMNGYENAEFLSMKQANLMGATLKKEIDEQGNVKYPKGAKIAFYKEYEYQPKLDSNGKQLYKTIKDKYGVEKQQPAMEKVYLKEPKLETLTLYHTSQFDDLDRSKLKERDLTNLNAKREANKDKSYDVRPKLNGLGMGANTTNDLNNFINSQNKGIDYEKIQHRQFNQQRVYTQDLNKGNER